MEPSCADLGVSAALKQGLGVLLESQGWRAPVDRFRASLEHVGALIADDGSAALREALAAECALWLETAETLAAVEPLYLSDEDDDAPAPIRALVVTDWPAGGRSARRGAAGCRG